MLQTWVKCLAALVASACLAGCDMDRVTHFTPEARITAAFPVSQNVSFAKDALLADLSEPDKKALNAQLDNKLKLRALSCANGYSPGWLASVESIRKAISGEACFAESDADLVHWLNLRRIGQLLSMSPIKPLPTKVPTFIVADDAIQDVRFASNAGVALVMTPRAIQVLSLGNNEVMFREPRSNGLLGELSPNGRLFVSGAYDGIRVRETQSGAVLAEWPQAAVKTFFWLDSSAAIFVSSNSSKAVLIDFTSGKEVPLGMLGQGVQRVMAVRGSPGQFVLAAWQKVWKINIDRSKPEPEVTLLAEQGVTDAGCGMGHCGLTDDGAYFFNATNKLTLLSLDSLTEVSVPFQPFYIQNCVATGDPDQILMTGLVQPSGGDSLGAWLYGISKQTMTSVDIGKFKSDRLLYIPSLHRIGVINDGTITVLDALSTTGTKSLEQFLSDALDLANQRKLAAFEREQAMLNSVGAFDPASRLRSIEGSRSVLAVPVGGLVGDLARDADVEGVGVYESEPIKSGARSNTPHAPGEVRIRVRRGARPVLLVLSAYEAVRWRVSIEPGAKLAGVLVWGYYASEVTGAGNARVIMMGNTHAYDRNTPEFQALNAQVMRATGKPFRVFQGAYRGASFSVGG